MKKKKIEKNIFFFIWCKKKNSYFICVVTNKDLIMCHDSKMPDALYAIYC